MMNLDAAINDWQCFLGTDRAVLGDFALRDCGMDASGVQREIPAALRIVDAVKLPEVMRIAHHHRVPVYALNTRRHGGVTSTLRWRGYHFETLRAECAAPSSPSP